MPRKKQPLIGNGMNANLLKEFIDLSYRGNTSVHPEGYMIDTPLSDSRVKVYTKNGSKDVIVTHRGSVGLDDWWDNAKYMTTGKVKGTKTYNLHRERHKKAIDKYGASNIIAIGHSRAGLYLQELQKEFPIKENITYNKASGFTDIGRTNDPNQTDVRVGNDIVSLLAPTQKNPNAIVKIDNTKNPLDFNKAHQTGELDKLGTTFIGKKDELEGSGAMPKPKTLEQLKKLLIKYEKRKVNLDKGKVYKTLTQEQNTYDIYNTTRRIKNYEEKGEDLLETKKKGWNQERRNTKPRKTKESRKEEPKKTMEVEVIKIKGKKYYKTPDDVVLDFDLNVIGMYKDRKLLLRNLEGKGFNKKQLRKIILDKNKVIADLEETAYGGMINPEPAETEDVFDTFVGKVKRRVTKPKKVKKNVKQQEDYDDEFDTIAKKHASDKITRIDKILEPYNLKTKDKQAVQKIIVKILDSDPPIFEIPEKILSYIVSRTKDKLEISISLVRYMIRENNIIPVLFDERIDRISHNNLRRAHRQALEGIISRMIESPVINSTDEIPDNILEYIIIKLKSRQPVDVDDILFRISTDTTYVLDDEMPPTITDFIDEENEKDKDDEEDNDEEEEQRPIQGSGIHNHYSYLDNIINNNSTPQNILINSFRHKPKYIQPL